MTPVEAFERVVHCLDRAHAQGFKVKAYLTAREVVLNTPADEIERRAKAGTLKELPG